MEPKQIFRCCTCNGFGTVSRPPNIAGDVLWHVEDKLYPCPACKSKGYIILEDDHRPLDFKDPYPPKKEKTQ